MVSISSRRTRRATGSSSTISVLRGELIVFACTTRTPDERAALNGRRARRGDERTGFDGKRTACFRSPQNVILKRERPEPMPDRLSLHAPVLVNTLGHCAGAIVFGILLYFLSLDWRRDRRGRGALPCVAAALALLWNLGSSHWTRHGARRFALGRHRGRKLFGAQPFACGVAAHLARRSAQNAWQSRDTWSAAWPCFCT